MLFAEQERWLSNWYLENLRAQRYGDALTGAANFFVNHEGTRQTHLDLARFLTLATIDPHGSLPTKPCEGIAVMCTEEMYNLNEETPSGMAHRSLEKMA